MNQLLKDQKVFPTETHSVDFCVVGGGMAGLCAAVAAARRWAKVVLMQDRAVLGGNASGEIRVTLSGADRGNQIPNTRETGILEELRLENCRRNPNIQFPIWDLLLYETAHFEPNLTLLLNCSVMDAVMDGNHIVSVTGWQLTTQTFHTVKAKIFADCSGEGILAPLTKAECRIGREARSEFGESIAPEKADRKTMGMTCIVQCREHGSVQTFEAPKWAYRFDTCDDIPYGVRHHVMLNEGYWWAEMGGEHDSTHDAEWMKDECLKITLGVWDHVKNRCPEAKADKWAIEYLSFMPGKRESRRYVGDHVLSQVDIDAEGKFDDLVAYGGWSMDDHHPGGFWSVRVGSPATIFHHSPCPYGIPYRSLYSKNIDNLMFAGRNHSCTHAAMSSTRLIATGGVMGQAVGTAAAMAVAHGISPREIAKHMNELQQSLIQDDCWLPWVAQDIPELTRQAKLQATTGNPDPLRDGTNRPIAEDRHAWTARRGDSATYLFGSPKE
ncbi:FAD-dependent oxidoreductase, partial [bacterium]|nr:FAD-dependent oxidoreductase [bacterium]